MCLASDWRAWGHGCSRNATARSAQPEHAPVCRQDLLLIAPGVLLGVTLSTCAVALLRGGHPIVVMAQFVEQDVQEQERLHRRFVELGQVARGAVFILVAGGARQSAGV